MKFVFILFIFTLFNYSKSYAFFSFSDYMPSPQKLNQVSYPRESQLLFRGMGTGQFDLDKALLALVGDSTAMIESLFFTTIKFKIMDIQFAKSVNLPSFVLNKIESIKKISKLKINEKKAIEYAIDIVDSYFEGLQKNDQLSPLYFDYRSNSFIDWPNNLVYTTVIQPAAASYGHNMAIIKEKRIRSLDLNYYNYIKNGIWYDHTRDIGEFVAPGYIPSDDIVGFQLRQSNGHSGFHEIRYVFVKRKIYGQPYIEVFSGFHSQYNVLSSCISLDEKGQAFHCHYRPGTLAMDIPSLTPINAYSLGVIHTCGSKSSCRNKIKKIPSPQNISSYKLSNDVDQTINNTKLDGVNLQFLSWEKIKE